MRLLDSNLRSAVAKANREVRSLGEADPLLAGLATTLPRSSCRERRARWFTSGMAVSTFFEMEGWSS